MTRRRNHLLSLCAIMLICPAVLAATPITPVCGDTIGPGGNFILTVDVGPCSTIPALTVDSASLNLGGHTILGSDVSSVGVLLTGSRARLKNGTVRDFSEDGVHLIGAGGHFVRNVTSRNNGVNGFQIDADDNSIRNCQAIDNGSDGFDINSTGNRLRGNAATDNGSDGFEVDGSDNRLTRNRSLENDSDGFEIDGDENSLVQNYAERNSSDGFEHSGLDSDLVGNTAIANGDDGFDIGSTGNRIVESRARDNFGFDAFDGVDACLSNRWRGNRFGTVSPSCIR